MIINESQIQLIAYSWEVLCEYPQSMNVFYDHLFEIAPETIHFFPDDISHQSDKLAHTMNFIVSNLEQLDNISDTIKDLGRFHNKIEIEPKHYIHLRVALIKTIKDNMGIKYHEEIGEAWDSVLYQLSQLMLKAGPKKKRKFISLLRRFR